MSTDPILLVALPGPLRTLFEYLPPTDRTDSFIPGARLRVPFGRRTQYGIYIRSQSESNIPGTKLRQVLEVIDKTPLLQPEDLAFLLWVSSYYQHPLGDVIFHALPTALRQGQSLPSPTVKFWQLTLDGTRLSPESLNRAPRQQQILQYLHDQKAGIEHGTLQHLCGQCTPQLHTLQEKGLIESVERPPQTVSRTLTQAPPQLTDDQKHASEQVNYRHFHCYLLDGVTGSGKTEVYLALIEKVIAQSRQVLVLVPEIGLTAQLVQRFERRLGMPITLLHSSLADGERLSQWLDARSGRAQVVVGTRSAIFTPLPRLGLIVVDEEHDLSYKQQEGFRYSARDMAVVRAQRADCPVILGSATPSLESLQNVTLKRYIPLHLHQRIGTATLPSMDLIDIRSVRLDGGLSPLLLRRIAAKLQAGEQVLLFLNRRGYAPVLTCHACGWLSTCTRCDARMTLHLGESLIWCHHCGYQQRTPEICPACGAPELRPLGQGTERLESVLQRHFPDTPVARIDRDSTRRKGSLNRLLAAIKADEYPLLIGTQMLAKGHHFPNVTLVALVDVDQGLFGADYRAGERMAQLVIQVAGRAGRAEKPGEVLIQTRYPDHPLLQTLVHQGYTAAAQQAMAERQAAHLPPFSHQALLRAESHQAELNLAFLEAASHLGKKFKQAKQLEFWGPVPAPMERRAGRYRAHLLIQATERGLLQAWLGEWVSRLDGLPDARKVRWSLDVDPQEMF